MVLKRKIVSETQKLLGIYGKMTERQIYYKLISQGIGKSGKSFANELSKILCEARRKRIVDPSLIIDTSREIRYTEPSKDDNDFSQRLDAHILRTIDEQFILDIWQDQNKMPIVVLEKFALGEIFEEITRPYGVPLIVNRGFTSDSKLFELSQLIPSTKEIVFQNYSDYDDSGKHMNLSLKRTAQYYISNGYNVEQSALTLPQVQNTKYKLQTISKTYKKTGITKQICELDALDPSDLKQIIKDNIVRYIDDPKMFNFRIQETKIQKKNLRKTYGYP